MLRLLDSNQKNDNSVLSTLVQVDVSGEAMKGERPRVAYR